MVFKICAYSMLVFEVVYLSKASIFVDETRIAWHIRDSALINVKLYKSAYATKTGLCALIVLLL